MSGKIHNSKLVEPFLLDAGYRSAFAEEDFRRIGIYACCNGLHFDGRVGQLWQLGLKFAQVSDVPLETVAFAAIRRFGRNF